MNAKRSIRAHIRIGLALVAVLVGGTGGWAALSDIAGAVIATGTVVVDSNIKKVQHPSGGIVGEIRARDGDQVVSGDLLVRLDDTLTSANLAIVSKGLDELSARKARLEAEREGDEAIKFPDTLLGRASDGGVAHVIASEARLFEIRRLARNGLRDQLRQRIVQLEEEVRGYKAQELAKAAEISLIA